MSEYGRKLSTIYILFRADSIFFALSMVIALRNVYACLQSLKHKKATGFEEFLV